jgi:hypothetical protein
MNWRAARRIPISTLRASRVAVPALWRHLVLPLAKLSLFATSGYAIVAMASDITTAILVQGDLSWSHVLMAKAIGGIFLGSSLTLLFVIAGSTSLTKRAIAMSWLLYSVLGLATVSMPLRRLTDDQDQLFWVNFFSFVVAVLAARLLLRCSNYKAVAEHKDLTHA